MAVTPKKRAAASARGSTRMAGATLGAMLLCASPSPEGGEEKSGATRLVPLVGSRRADRLAPVRPWVGRHRPHQIWIGGVSKQKPHHHRIRRAVALQCGRWGGGRSGGRPVDGRPAAGGRPTGAGRGRGRAWMGREEGTAAGRGERGGRPGGRKRDLKGRVSTGRILYMLGS
jgi:hypothetical protein